MRIFCLVTCILLGLNGLSWFARTAVGETSWQAVVQLAPAGRFDAVVYLGRGVVLVGSRENDAGRLFKSHDCGATWTDLGHPVGGAILNLLALDAQTMLASTLNGHIWKSKDAGKTWADRGLVASRRIYSMACAADGSLLAAEYNENGGRIHKSTDQGEHWKVGEIISERELYRLQPVRDGMLVNGEAGHIYKSIDSGSTWRDLGRLTTAPLYAIETLPDGIVLLGDGEGKIFRSTDDGNSWRLMQDVGDPLDDFVAMPDGLAFLSAYDGKKHLYRSMDAGVSWQDMGPTPNGDVLDHAIVVNDVAPPIAIGGTNQGRILRALRKYERP